MEIDCYVKKCLWSIFSLIVSIGGLIIEAWF